MSSVTIERHKTALKRKELSKPVRLALEDGLISPAVSVFDYGCGRGEDIRRLRKEGIKCQGWDPNFLPDGNKAPSEVVNLGYVVNVIEDVAERVSALQQAWQLTEKVLVVAARIEAEARKTAFETFQDGCVTGWDTFQKFYDQQELRNWIDQTLSAQSVPAAPGICYIFRDTQEREGFLAARWHRRYAMPRLQRSEELFEQHRELLQPLMEFLSRRGRLPGRGELDSEEIEEVFGTLPRAFSVIRRVTGEEQWVELTQAYALDLLVYLALSRFDGRPRLTQLPQELQRDVKAFFSTYTRAVEVADELLFSLGDMENIAAGCVASPIGKLTPSALYIHQSALPHLNSILRIYEGCARGYIGKVEGANIMKLSRDEPRISYLAYPGFDADPHPALQFSISVNLQTFRMKSRRYDTSANPPILHRKETFVDEEYPLREKFARLTKQEERRGLYEDVRSIGTRSGWAKVLQQAGVECRGHRLVNVQARKS